MATRKKPAPQTRAPEEPKQLKPRAKVLSRKDRDALYNLACRVVQADPEIEAKFEAAAALEREMMAKVNAMLVANVEELFDPADMAVLAKYGHTRKPTSMQVQLKDEAASSHDAGVSYGGHYWRFPVDDNGVPLGPKTPILDMHDVPWNERDEWCARFPSTERIVLAGDDEALFKKWVCADEDVNLLTDQREKLRRDLLADYRALIEGARTYEAVLEVWPEASALRGTIAPQNTALSVLSTDALTRIKQDIRRRAALAVAAE